MKKHVFSLGLMLVAALAFTNCAKQEVINDIPEQPAVSAGVPFELTAGMDTKTATTDGATINWAANDALNVFVAEHDGSFSGNKKFTSTDGSKTFKGELDSALDGAKTYDWKVVYPYNEDILTVNTHDGNKGYLTLGSKTNATQTQSGNNNKAHLAGSHMPLYGVVKDVSGNDSPSVTLSQVMSVVKVHVTNATESPLVVSTVNVAAPAGTLISGTFFLDFSGDTPVFESSGASYTSNVAKLTVTDGDAIDKNGTADFYVAIKPFTQAAAGVLTVSINGYEKEITIPASTEFKPGKIKTVNFSYDAVPPIYSTEFNYPIDGSSYTSATPIQGTDSEGTSWYITYGNWNGSNCAQLRVYSAGNFGAIYNGFDCSYVTSVSYDAKVSNTNLKLNTYYSTDSGTNWVKVDNEKSLTTSFAKYSFVVSSTGEFSKVRIKFEVAGTKPKSGNYQLTIDNVKIYGNGAVLGDPSIVASNVTDVPAIGVVDANLTYTIHNFTGADDVEAAGDGTVVVASAVSDHAGTVTYSVNPNYGTSARNGSITLSSDSQGANKVVSVAQLGETFNVSGTTVTILKDETKASFTITTPTFGWTAVASPADEKNLTISSAASGPGNASAQTITVSSTTAAGAEEQTLGTIVIYRNGNVDDPQKKVITIKKASTAVVSTYSKVTTSITDGGTYLICNASTSRVVTGVLDSSHLSTTAITIKDETITGSDTITEYEFVITPLTGEDSGKFTIKHGSDYIGWDSSTNFQTATSIPTGDSASKFKWTISIVATGEATIQTGERIWKYYASKNDFRPYTTQSYTLPTLFKLN